MALGGHRLKIRHFWRDFVPFFKVYILVSVHPTSFKLSEVTTLGLISRVVLSAY